MKIIYFVNNKGGVGKTTSAQNIGSGLQKFAEARVLLIDLDEQASLTKSFAINSDQTNLISGAYIAGKAKFEDCIVQINSSMDILPSSHNQSTYEDSIKSAPTFPFNLKRALDKIKNQYDYVVLDCPPALSGMTKIALVTSDFYFVPLQAEFLSYEGLRSFLQYTAEIQEISPNSHLGGVFATRYNPKTRRKLNHDLVSTTKEQLGSHFLKTSIRDNIVLSEAQARGMSIFDYAPESNGAADYYELTKEILSKIG